MKPQEIARQLASCRCCDVPPQEGVHQCVQKDFIMDDKCYKSNHLGFTYLVKTERFCHKCFFHIESVCPAPVNKHYVCSREILITEKMWSCNWIKATISGQKGVMQRKRQQSGEIKIQEFGFHPNPEIILCTFWKCRVDLFKTVRENSYYNIWGNVWCTFMNLPQFYKH